MYAIEFQTIVKDGKIEIPAEYQQQFNTMVKVILLVDDAPSNSINLIDQLLHTPLSVKEFRPLSRGDIYAR